MRKTLLQVFSLAAMGLLIRLDDVRSMAWSSGDSPEYLTLAKNIAFHHVFSLDTEAASLLPTARRPPLYPALIAALWWGDAPPLTAIMLLQAALGAATVVLVYLMARDSFNDTVAVIASAAVALSPMSSHYTAVIMTETLFTFLVTCGLFFWGRERPIGAGVFFGLGALTRPTLIPFLILLPLLSLVPAWRSRWRLHLLILCTALAVSSVWIVRNAVVFGEFIPVAASGWGTNLLVGTIETKFAGDDVWTAVLHDPALQVDVRGASETEADRILMRRAISRIRDNPSRWIGLRLKQFPRAFIDSGDYWLGAQNITFAEALDQRRLLVLLTKSGFVIGNLLLLMLAVYGAYTERARFVRLSHLMLFPIFLIAAQLPMWVEARYSLPLVPLMVILAVAGAARLAGALPALSRERLMIHRVRRSPSFYNIR